MFGRPSSLCFQHWAGLVILSFCLNKQPAAPTGPLVEDVFWYPQKIFPFPFVFAFSVNPFNFTHFTRGNNTPFASVAWEGWPSYMLTEANLHWRGRFGKGNLSKGSSILSSSLFLVYWPLGPVLSIFSILFRSVFYNFHISCATLACPRSAFPSVSPQLLQSEGRGTGNCIQGVRCFWT